MRVVVVFLIGVCLAAGSAQAQLQGPVSGNGAVEARLFQTLQELAALGYKQTGTPEGNAAGDYVAQRFTQAGLGAVRFESFQFPFFELAGSSLDIDVDGVSAPMAHDVFAYSGSGSVSAEVVYVGEGRPQNYLNVMAGGKVVMVDRNVAFHRSSQYLEVVAHGGIGMLYRSTSPNNLIQIGTVSAPEDGLGPIPSITVGFDDGQTIIDALASGSTVRATMDVSASIRAEVGRNVVGELAGTDPSGAYILVGAHYDTWQIGSADNSTGVAVMLEIAERLASRPPGPWKIVFVGFDGEEPGLFGGYDYLRDHVIRAKEPMLAFVNLEIPGSGATDIRALGRTVDGRVDEVLSGVLIENLYDVVVDMAVVAQIFGGIIPTDIQGMYWYGLQGLSTACDTPYYHTVADTPDKIDVPFLAASAVRLRMAVERLRVEPMASFQVRDSTVWEIRTTTSVVGGGLRLDIEVVDHQGVPQPGARLDVWLDVDDFFRVFRVGATTDGAGRASVVLPSAALSQGSSHRFVHVTAGVTYPLAETIRFIPAPL